MKTSTAPSTSSSASEPRLDPPGAGLPALEHMIANMLFAWSCLSGSRERFTRTFQAERERVVSLARRCDAESGARRVLIRRLPGLEDSSRYWSVFMTLEHLCLVHEGIARVITSLGQGKVPPGKASTAAVKPAPGADERTIETFELSCDKVLKAAESVPDLRTGARYDHPWFGALDAYGWYAMAPFHLRLHRRQIEVIRAGL
ncbi:hypothetical protein DB346_22590 [Verrucomicrobia bacterium LW23]|nr:hypothetical protein DB346_22590 [Verrucomicrobia bacterium LW23]